MPSDKILAKKQAAVALLAADLKSAESIVFSEYQGLTVEQDTQMRHAFREGKLNYRVVKNTQLLRAFNELGVTGLEEVLTGPTAIAWSNEDITLAPRLVKKYVEDFKKMKIKGGVIEGALAPLDTITALSNIPSIEVLHGQLVSSLIFPVTSLAMTLGAMAKKAEEQGLENVKDLVTGHASSDQEAAPAEDAAPAAEANPEEKVEAPEEAPAPATEGQEETPAAEESPAE